MNALAAIETAVVLAQAGEPGFSANILDSGFR